LGLTFVKNRVYDSKPFSKPFVKWAGGKGQLLYTFRQFYPPQLLNGSLKRYVEPFVGGGALLFEILQSFNVKEAVILDINSDLINTYRAVRDKPAQLTGLLGYMEREYLGQDVESRRETYYGVRDAFNSRKVDIKNGIDIEKAAQFLFLNKTCFNGLYRVNRTGDFNVPFGDYKNPTICDAENIAACSELLRKTEIICGDYHQAWHFVDNSSFVYFDPPYRPLNATSSFTSYSKFDFNDDDQVELASFYRQLNDTGAYLMLSNSDPKNTDVNDRFFDELYDGFNITGVEAKRAINSKGESRGVVKEILVTNYVV
jgi:DNA adenine methylase